MESTKFKTVEEYLSAQPKDIRDMLQELRNTIKQAAPEAKEVISYNMPAFRQNGILVYYAAHKEHIGFYPGAAAVNEAFKEQLRDYETSKGTIRLPFGKALPIKLIKDIVAFRVKQDKEKIRLKTVKR